MNVEGEQSDQCNIHTQQYFNASPVAMRIVNKDFEIIRQNKRMAEMANTSHQEALGMKCYDQFSGEYCNTENCTLLKILNEEEEVKCEVIKKTKDGKLIPTFMTSVPYYDDSGNLIGIFESFQNITQLKAKEEELRRVMDELIANIKKTVQTLSSTIEKRDPYIAGHQRKVSRLCHAIGRELGLPSSRLDGIKIIGAVHDIGKIEIPMEILNKPGKLRDKEFELIKDHSETGYKILEKIEFQDWPIAKAVLQHHEKLDGSGYPAGLEGDDIMLEARIVTVADIVEAISSHRPYRPALGIDTALEEIENLQGTKLDSEIVNICLELFKEDKFSFEE